MALRIRRGTEPQRTGVILEMGEIVWTTDAKQLWVGDGLQPGGYPVVGANVAGFGLVFNTSSKRLEVGGLTTNDIPEGTNNKYFSTDLAQDAAALLFSTGSHTGITFQYDDTLGKINAVVTLDVTTTDNIRELAQDSVWSMLQNGSHSNIAFTYTDNGAATGTINATVTLDGIGITSVSADLSPTLGGNLGLNSRNITGTGNINITGDATVTGTVTNGALTLDGSNIKCNLTTVTIGESVTNLNDVVNYSRIVSLISTTTNGALASAGSFENKTSRGTTLSPVACQVGDYIGGFGMSAYNGSTYDSIGVVISQIDTVTGTTPNPGKILLGVRGANGPFVGASLNSKGVFESPSFKAGDGTAANPSIGFTTDTGADTGFFHPADGVLCISTDSTERVRVDNGGMRVEGFMKVKNVAGALPSPAEAGMIVLDGTTFKGYDGSAWVNLN
jgi:hypothetical protein